MTSPEDDKDARVNKVNCDPKWGRAERERGEREEREERERERDTERKEKEQCKRKKSKGCLVDEKQRPKKGYLTCSMPMISWSMQQTKSTLAGGITSEYN